MRSQFFSALAFCAVMAASSLAFASPESDLAAAENSYAALDYPNASQQAEAVLAQRGLSHDMLTRATRVAALSHAALGHAEQAKQQFILLLQYDQDFKVDTKLGPRFSEPFAEARGYWMAQGRKPGMEVQAVMTYNQPGQVRVSTVDPLNSVKKVVVGYRWAPSREYTTVQLEPGTKSAEVPANPSGAGRLDYYVRAVDAKDNAVFEEGTAEAPKSTTVSEPPKAAAGEEKKSFFTTVPFFIIAGAVVAGAAVGGFFLLRPTEYQPSTTGRTTFTTTCGATGPCI